MFDFIIYWLSITLVTLLSSSDSSEPEFSGRIESYAQVSRTFLCDKKTQLRSIFEAGIKHKTVEAMARRYKVLRQVPNKLGESVCDYVTPSQWISMYNYQNLEVLSNLPPSVDNEKTSVVIVRGWYKHVVTNRFTVGYVALYKPLPEETGEPTLMPAGTVVCRSQESLLQLVTDMEERVKSQVQGCKKYYQIIPVLKYETIPISGITYQGLIVRVHYFPGPGRRLNGYVLQYETVTKKPKRSL